MLGGLKGSSREEESPGKKEGDDGLGRVSGIQGTNARLQKSNRRQLKMKHEY